MRILQLHYPEHYAVIGLLVPGWVLGGECSAQSTVTRPPAFAQEGGAVGAGALAPEAPSRAPVQPGLRFPDGLGPRSTVPLTDLPAPSRRMYHPGGSWILSLSEAGGLLASTNEDGHVAVFDTFSGEVVWTWHSSDALETSIGDLVWPHSATHYKLAGRRSSKPRTKHVWPGGYGAVFGPRGYHMTLVQNPGILSKGVTFARTFGLERAPGIWAFGGYIHVLEGAAFNLVGVIETDVPVRIPYITLEAKRRLKGVSAAALSPDGAVIAAGTSAGMLAYWDAQTLNPGPYTYAEAPQLSRLAVRSVAFSPDAQHIATAGDSGYVRIWSLPQLQLDSRLGRHGGAAFWVQFAPDGRSLASAGWDGTVRVWDLAARGPATTFNWREHFEDRPAFTYTRKSDSAFVGGTADTGMIGVIDFWSGQVTDLWPAGLADVRALAYAPEANILAAGSEAGDILVWRLDAE